MNRRKQTNSLLRLPSERISAKTVLFCRELHPKVLYLQSLKQFAA